MEIQNGYLYYKGELKLLSSTEKLLNLLRRDKKLVVLGSDKNVEENKEEEEQENNNVNDDDNNIKSNSSVHDDDDDDDDDNYIVKNKLERIYNMADTILAALNDIQRFKQRNIDKKKKKEQQRHNVSYMERKTHALEEQRERLQKQKQQQQQQQNNNHTTTNNNETESSSNDDDNDDDDGNDDDKEDNDDDSDDDEEENESRDHWLLIVASINSLKILTPILLNILLHKCRNDHNLIESVDNAVKKNQRNQKRTASCILIGKYVYDFTSNKFCKRLFRTIQEIYLMIGITNINEESLITNNNYYNECKTRLQYIQQSIIQCYNKQPIKYCIKDHYNNNITKEQFQEYDKKFNFISQQNNNKLNENKKQHDLYLKSINSLHERLTNLFQQKFPNSRLSMYGSCLSDLSLGKNADVDLSLYIPELDILRKDFQQNIIDATAYQKKVRDYVFQTCRCLQRQNINNSNSNNDKKLNNNNNNSIREFINTEPVHRARVPVVRGRWILANNPHSDDGTIDFDICFLNDIAVVNSELLRQYTLIDNRIKTLIMLIKQWAKQQNIATAQDNCISSYTWTNMVIFYLIQINFIPNLQSNILMKQLNIQQDINNIWHNINDLNTFFIKYEQILSSNIWSIPEEHKNITITELLYGFFHFYTKLFPTCVCMISIKNSEHNILPKTVFRKVSYFLCIEDPFETYNSHCPHDLGMPANESGSKKIIHCLHDAQQYLYNILFNKQSSSNDTLVWPPPITNNINTGKVGRKQQQRKGMKRKSNNNDNENNNNKKRDDDNKRGGGKKEKKQNHSKGQQQQQQQGKTGKGEESDKNSKKTNHQNNHRGKSHQQHGTKGIDNSDQNVIEKDKNQNNNNNSNEESSSNNKASEQHVMKDKVKDMKHHNTGKDQKQSLEMKSQKQQQQHETTGVNNENKKQNNYSKQKHKQEQQHTKKKEKHDSTAGKHESGRDSYVNNNSNNNNNNRNHKKTKGQQIQAEGSSSNNNNVLSIADKKDNKNENMTNNNGSDKTKKRRARRRRRKEKMNNIDNNPT